MKKERIYCDICGKEFSKRPIEPGVTYRVLKYNSDASLGEPKIKEYDICPECMLKVLEYCVGVKNE